MFGSALVLIWIEFMSPQTPSSLIIALLIDFIINRVVNEGVLTQTLFSNDQQTVSCYRKGIQWKTAPKSVQLIGKEQKVAVP